VLLAFLHHGRFADASGKCLRQLLVVIALPVGGMLVAPTLLAGYRIGWAQGNDALGAFLQHADPTAPVIGFSLLWFALIAAVLEAPQWIGSRLLGQPWLLTLGALSYALYMFHPVVLDILTIVDIHTGWLPGASLTVAYFALTFAAAAFSRRFIEVPLDRFKQHFPLRREPLQ
jgi:peptidoglycan/LPS O-acetylase OafA/YrhL